MFTEESAKYFGKQTAATIELIEELCKYPAPSGKEEQRAAFCKQWLEDHGAKDVYIDSACNVVYPVNCEGKKKLVLFCAHTDTVFPDTEPMPFINDGEYLHSPGVGDDTACLAMLMQVAEYVTKENLSSDYGVVFVANACEEGLGNLKGTRQIMEDLGDKVVEFYTFDATYNHIFNRIVGSERYKITMKTPGGHSFYDFGNQNAIVAVSQLITELYKLEVPQVPGCKTTYNVGIIQGGHSVNTIAEEASFLYEYRSDDYKSLATMREQFRKVLESFQATNPATITLETVGIRPCGNLKDTTRLEEMAKRAIQITEKHTGQTCIAESASTDCNIPMSMGIPAICVGSYMGQGAHTKDEKIRIDSLDKGLKIVAETILDFFH